MRLSLMVGVLVLALAPNANATNLFATHTCYYNRPAHPLLETETKLVILEPGYWEFVLVPSAYERTEDSSQLLRRKGRANRPHADRMKRVWHEPIYAKVTEQVVVDPGHETLLRAKGCRSHW